MTTSRKGKPNLQVIAGGAKSKVEDDVDALFRLPLSEFIGARKTLAARLKKEGRADDADHVTALAKPSISAWTVNQLYWQHRESFDRLLATGQRFRQAQKSGKVSDMREALDARRNVLSHVSDLATTLLRAAGHNPTLEMMRRIATTLEAMSAYASLPDGLSAGRLTEDIDPPGFDSLASSVAGGGTTKRNAEAARVNPPKKAVSAAVKAQQKSKPSGEARLKEARQAELAAAKASLQEAKRSLVAARASVQSLEAAQKKADAEAKETEKQKREAEKRFKAAAAASVEAVLRAQRITLEVERARKLLQDAKNTVEQASEELESLFRGRSQSRER